jgi:uncharacterized protein
MPVNGRRWFSVKHQLGLWAVVCLSACEPRVSVGDLGEASDGSAGSKPSTVVPKAEAGSAAEAPTGEAGAGGAGLAGPDGETGGSSAGIDGSSGSGAGRGGSPVSPSEFYSPRTGPFTMVVYSSTLGFRHQSAIDVGKVLLQEIADEQGFNVVLTEDNAFLDALASFEAVFFLNTTGDVFSQQEEQLFEAWMSNGGAFIGTHSATDTENGWAYYSELTGQYYDGHGPAGTPASLELEPSKLTHPTLKDLPNPWQHTDEWPRFNSHLVWSTKPGFQILVRNSDDGHPVSWLREFGSFRSFYTGLGHDAPAFSDPFMKKHLTGAIMWAVRREHLIQ